jgi:hypothetical protein
MPGTLTATPFGRDYPIGNRCLTRQVIDAHTRRKTESTARPTEREANLALLPGARSITLDDTGHFAALEQPARVTEILLASTGA